MVVSHPKIHKVGAGNLFLNMAVVAESGFGKSVLLGSANDKMLIISMDPEGTDSAFYQKSKADEWVVRDFVELEEVYKFLRNSDHKYEYVGVDSASEAQKIMQRHWLEKNRANAGKRDPDVLGIDGYQITQNQFIKFVKQMNDLPMHTIYTAKPQEHFDGEGNAYYLPNIHGQKGDMARDFMGYMKIQGFGTFEHKKVKRGGEVVDKIIRRYYFQPYGPYKGKDRTDSLGEYLDDPTLPDLAARVVAKATEAQRTSAPVKKAAARRRTTRS